MNLNTKFEKRFSDLEKYSEEIESSKYEATGSNFAQSWKCKNVDHEKLLKWSSKVRNLLFGICGEDSQYFSRFIHVEDKAPPERQGSYHTFSSLRAIFLAAKEDFDSGYLVSAKALIQAEVFDSEIEQAETLLSSGYDLAAAVIAGVVLETTLRELCQREGIAIGKLDKMNSDLAKAGVYTKLVQKQVTALADIRNSAAHGKREQFTREHVSGMVKDVSRLLAEFL